MIDAGYFRKRIVTCPKEIDAPQVREVCSVSDHISSGPDGWVECWIHNDFGWFNSVADATRVVPQPDRPAYRLFAYRVAPYIYRGGDRIDLQVPADVRPESIPVDFVSRGFDAASKSDASVLGLECSPLSCNYLASEIPTNEFCLFPSVEAASAGAERFSRGGAEPGDYYVIQVLEAPDNMTDARRPTTAAADERRPDELDASNPGDTARG
jgi:hypothetical protein